MPPDNWIYVQEPDVKIGRLQIFNNWSPALVADPDTIWLGLEYFCREGDELWSMKNGRLIDFAAEELAKLNLIERRDILDGTVVPGAQGLSCVFRRVSALRHRPRLFGRVPQSLFDRAQRDASLQQSGSLDALGKMRRRFDHQRRPGKSKIWDINADESYTRKTSRSDPTAARDKICQSVTLRVTTASGRRRFYVKRGRYHKPIYLVIFIYLGLHACDWHSTCFIPATGASRCLKSRTCSL